MTVYIYKEYMLRFMYVIYNFDTVYISVKYNIPLKR